VVSRDIDPSVVRVGRQLRGPETRSGWRRAAALDHDQSLRGNAL